MNAFELLKKDHKEAHKLFEQLEGTSEEDADERGELFTQLKQALELHAHIEEAIFYPALKRESETREITLEGLEEHHVMKLLLRELDGMKTGTEQWAAKLKVLEENVRHHVQEEEGEMFPKAQEVLGAEQINQLGTQMQQEKQARQRQMSAGSGR